MLSIDCEEEENDDKKLTTNTPKLPTQANPTCALKQKLFEGIERLKVPNQDHQITPRKNPRSTRKQSSSVKKSINKKRKRRQDFDDSSDSHSDNSDTDDEL